MSSEVNQSYKRYPQNVIKKALIAYLTTGRAPEEISKDLGLAPTTVRNWRSAYLKGIPRGFNKHPMTHEQAERMVESRMRKVKPQPLERPQPQSAEHRHADVLSLSVDLLDLKQKNPRIFVAVQNLLRAFLPNT